MKCRQCKYFKIVEKAMFFNGYLWSTGKAECTKNGYTKTFKNDLEVDRLECIGGEYQSRSSIFNAVSR